MSDPDSSERRVKLIIKLEAYVGPCVACGCDVFEPGGFADGFEQCVCFHTRWAHEKVSE